MPFYRATLVFLVYTFVYAWIDLIPFANSLAPPSNNPDVLRSYILRDNNNNQGSSRCWETLLFDPSSGEEEDEVEYWYPTRKRHFEFAFGSQQYGSSITSIRQTSFGCGKLGSEVWDSSVALCLYLGQQEFNLEGRRILELGAGCGLPSVVCMKELGASTVMATDFWEQSEDNFDGDRLVPTKFHGLNLEYNLQQGSGLVQCLDWHDRETATVVRDSFQPDLIIGSDLVYYPMDVEPLLQVLETLLGSNNNSPRAILALPLAPAEREALPEFRSKVQARFSQTHTVTLEEIDLIREDTDGEDSIHLFIDICPAF